MRYKTFVFDLDNTIIRETDYLFVAYNRIADYICSEYGISDKNSVYSFLRREFLNGGRKNLFNNLNSKFKINESIDTYLNILRSCTFDKPITIIDSVFPILSDIYNDIDKSIYILTNGNIMQQKNKIENIDWRGLDIKANVIFANAYIAKPDPIGLNIIVKESLSYKEDTVFIGDSNVDKECAERAAIDFYYVNDFLNEYIID